MAYQGHLDWPRGRELVGWVFDPEQPGHRARVEIQFDGAPLRTRIASNFRADLKQAGIGDGCHAFSVELPEAIFDGQPHRIEASIDGVGFQSFVYQSKYSGAIEEILPRTVRCRIEDESQPGHAVIAEVYADGRFLSQGCGLLPVPRGFDIGSVRRLELRARGCAEVVAVWSAPPAPVFQPVAPPSEPVDVVVDNPPGTTITALLRTLESIAASSNECATDVYADASRHRDALLEAQPRLGFRIGPPPLAGTAGTARDTVQVAAGALVYGSWVDRLRAAAYADASVATASPLTGGPIDGHTARELDAYAQRKQRSRVAVIEAPSDTCVYRRAGGGTGSVHVLAGDVRVEALHGPSVPAFFARVEAAKLQRTVEEFAMPLQPAASVLPDGTLLVGGLRYWLLDDSQDYDALARAVPRGITVDSVLAPPALADSGMPYTVDVRDYGWICPRGDLIDETGRYCGEPSIEACERCLRKLGPWEGLGGLLHRVASVAELREQSRQLLDGAALVKFPSKDAAQRMSRYCSPKAARISEVSPELAWRKPAGPPFRIRRIGDDTAIWQACVWDAKKRELPLEFVIYGEAHAEWRPSEAPLLAVPEFTLYPIQFDIGAVAEGALRIPCGLPAGRINDQIVRGLGS